MTMGVYAITCTVTGDCYIGESINTEKRWKHHRQHLKGGYHANTLLQNAWKQYGADTFSFAVLEEVAEKHMLIQREGYYLCERNATGKKPGYNLTHEDHRDSKRFQTEYELRNKHKLRVRELEVENAQLRAEIDRLRETLSGMNAA